MSEATQELLLFGGIALVAGLLCGALAPLFGRSTGLVDSRDRDPEGRPISRAGGTALLLAWCVALSAAGQLGGELLPLVGCVAGAWLIGLHDDFTDSSPRLRVVALALLAVGGSLAGLRCETLVLPGLEPLPLGSAAIPLSALWILGATVAFDFIDGLDGLALTLGLVATGCLLAVSGSGPFVLALVTLTAAQLGLLAWNRPPASLYLGDNGSNLLGFAIGALTVAGLRQEDAFPLLPGLLLVSVPVVDAALTMLRRARRGGSLFDSDLGHIHHRLQRSGRGPWGVLFVLAAVAAGLGFLGVLLARLS